MMTDGQDVDFVDLDFLCLSPTQQDSSDVKENANLVTNQSSWQNQNRTVCTQSSEKVDDLVNQILNSAKERKILEQRLFEFQQRAETIRQMYENEKRLRQEYFKKHEETERKCAEMDQDLVIKNLELEQVRAQCAEIKPPPFEYKLLISRYIKLAQTLNEMRLLQCSDQTLLKQLQKYCQEKGIKIPSTKVPKSPRTKTASVSTADKQVQCEFEPKVTPVRKVNACTQYISTVSTRGTSTVDLKIKGDVDVMHETPLSQLLPKPLPSVDVMLKELLQYDISHRVRLQPLSDVFILPRAKSTTVGTCTELCNVQRNIDFTTVESKFAATQTFNTLQNDATTHCQTLQPQLFNKLWSTFGCMVYALMNDDKQLQQNVELEEKFSSTMAFTKDILKAWLNQVIGLPTFPANIQMNPNFSTLDLHNYNEFKFDVHHNIFNESTQEFNEDKPDNNLTDSDALAKDATLLNSADDEIECIGNVSNDVIVLDSSSNSDNNVTTINNPLHKNRSKHLKRCASSEEAININESRESTNEVNTSEIECQCENVINEGACQSSNRFADLLPLKTSYEINRIVLRSNNKNKSPLRDKHAEETQRVVDNINRNLDIIEENINARKPKYVDKKNGELESDTTNELIDNRKTSDENYLINNTTVTVGHEKEKRKNRQVDDNDMDIKKARISCRINMETIEDHNEAENEADKEKESRTYEQQNLEDEFNCDSPKMLVIDYDVDDSDVAVTDKQLNKEASPAKDGMEAIKINSVAEINCTVTEASINVDESVESVINEIDQESELQNVFLELFGNESNDSDIKDINCNQKDTNMPSSAIEINEIQIEETTTEIEEPDDINEDINPAHIPKEIPLELKYKMELKGNNRRHKSCLMHKFVRNYSTMANKMTTGPIKKYKPCCALREHIITYITNRDLNNDVNIAKNILQLTENLRTTIKCMQISKAIIQCVRDLETFEQNLQNNEYMQENILKLVSLIEENAEIFKTTLITELELTIFNPISKTEKLQLHQLINLTALYLLIKKSKNLYSARLFIAKILYYYNARAPPMIYMVLCQHPTALPHREDRAHNAMDPLVNVIQHLLMSTKYNMDNSELLHRELLSKLRFEYHYEPFQPDRNTVLNILITNLQSNHDLHKIPYAFALFCKRLNHQLVQKDIIQAKLIPLINNWRTNGNYNEQLAVLLDCLSVIIKPFPLQMDVSVYLSLFQQFINSAHKKLKESAVHSILRLQRFGFVNCFNSLLTLDITNSEFESNTIAMLRTFIHRKPLTFWENVCPDVFNI